MKGILAFAAAVFFLTSCIVKKDIDRIIAQNDVERIIRTLSADDMQGRAIFSPGIEKAARVIEQEFKAIGLKPLAGEDNFRQDFSMINLSPSLPLVTVNGEAVDPNHVVVITDEPTLSWSSEKGIDVQYIKSGESFTKRYGKIKEAKKPTIVFVAEEFVSTFRQLHNFFMRDRAVRELEKKPEMVFVLGPESVSSYQVNFSNKIDKAPIFNIAGIIPGKTRPSEYIIFSSHYDHIGIMEEAAGDSVANGADDNASGVAAVISLARYYKNLNNNARTLIFVAFTGEESGLLGSAYFATTIKPAEVIAMLNIEMIGKESKFGNNTAFLSGFERSDLGSILQASLVRTDFTLHPDPYPAQNLFNRSDNAPLAALGIPAHTISTVQIDKDKLYHTVDDEIETLDMERVTATVKAIALSAKSIIDGSATPSRISPLNKENP